MTPLTHIVPRYPPQIDGLGDYCHLLVKNLEDSHQIPSRIIIGDPAWRPTRPVKDVMVLSSRGRVDLLKKLENAETVILHYVGYGYHHRGVPFWINRALKAWKAVSSKHRLIIVFHELWSFGPPWKTEFYLSLIQRYLVRQLHRIADASMTSVPIYIRGLEAIQSGKTIFQPIPSAFPTMISREGLSSRPSNRPIDIITFGQEASRLQSIKTHQGFLQSLHLQNRLGRIRVVGKGASESGIDVRHLRTFLPASKIEIHPNVTPDEGSRLLRSSDIFLSFYPSAFLCKSSAMMAALGNGCVPLLSEALNSAPLVDGEEILACDGSTESIKALLERINPSNLDLMASKGTQWYNDHASWKKVTQSILPLLNGA